MFKRSDNNSRKKTLPTYVAITGSITAITDVCCTNVGLLAESAYAFITLVCPEVRSAASFDLQSTLPRIGFLQVGVFSPENTPGYIILILPVNIATRMAF
jgi:hypothetical protein